MTDKQIKVLLLEDEAAHAEAIRRALESTGNAFKLQVAGTLIKFNKLLADETPDIALLDMFVPDGNGIDLLSAPAEANAYPMLILTSHGNEQAAVTALKAGALDYIVKSPETFANMPRIVTSALNQWTVLKGRKQAEQALLVSEQNFRNSMENSPLGIRIVSEDGETLYTNRAFLNIYGYQSIEEFKTTPVKDRYTPGSYIEFHERRDKRRKKIALQDNYEVSIVRKDGKVRQLQVIRKEIPWGGHRQYQTIYQDITEHREAEVALQQSEARFRTTVQNAPVGIATVALDHHIINANDTFCRILGYPESELQKLTFKDFTHPDDLGESIQRIEALNAGEITFFTLDKRYMKKDGTVIFGKVVLNLLRDNTGKPLSYIAELEDFTERQQAEEALKTSEGKYSTLVEESSDGIIILSDRKIEFVNQQILKMSGYSQNEIAGKSFPELFAPEYTELLDEGYQQRKSTSVILPTEYRLEMLTKDKKKIPVETKAQRINFNESDKSMVIVHDVTERKKAEEALKESEAKYRLIVENSRDVIFTFNAEGKFIYISPSVNNVLGYNPADLIGKAFVSLVHPDDLQELQQALSRNIKDGSQTPGGNEFRIRHASGEWRWHNSSGNAVFDAGGKLMNFVGITKDITERKQMTMSINELNNILQLITNINQLIVKVDNETELLQKACEQFVVSRQYMLAWIGFIKEGSYDILPSVKCGESADYLTSAKITWDDSPFGRGPTGTAMKTGKLSVIRDIRHDPDYEPWREMALQMGIKSSVALPLVIRNKTIGVLNIYSAITDAFDQKELDLLEEMAADLSLGIEKIRQREELTLAHEALLEEERKLREAQELAHLGYWKWDVKTGDVEWSEEVFKIFRLDPKEFKPQIDSILVLSPWEEDHQRNLELIKRATETHKPGSYEQKFLHPDNSIGYYYSTFQGKYDEKGELISIIGTVLDITERKLAEEALKESEYNFHNFLDNSSLGIRVRNTDHTVSYSNKALLDIFGYKNAEESEIHPPQEYYSPQDYAEYLARREKIARGEPVANKVEVDIVRKDGTIRHVQIFGHEVIWNGKPQSQTYYNDVTELKTTQEALKASEQNFRNLINSSSMGIRIRDKNGQTLYVNQTLLNIFGYKTIDEVTSNPLVDHYSPEEQARYFERKKKRLRGESVPEDFQVEIVRKDGTRRQLQVFRNEVFWDGKQQYQVIYNDITELKQAQDAVKASEQNFRNLIDGSLFGIRITDVEDNTLYSNQAFQAIFGYESIDEVRTNPPLNRYTPESYAGFLTRKERLLRGEPRQLKVEVDIVRKDGEIRHLQLSTAETFWNGRTQYQTIYNDVTERVQAEEAVKLSEQNFRNSLEGFFIGVYIADKDWYPSFANQRFLEIFGYKNIDEVRAMPPHEYYTPEAYTDLNQRRERKLHGQLSPDQIEVAITRKDGAVRHLEIYRKEIFWDGKKQWELLYNDITERVQAEEALKLSEQNLRNSMDSSLIGIRIVDMGWHTLYANQVFMDIFGYKDIDDIGVVSPKELYAPEEYARYLEREEKRKQGVPVQEIMVLDIVRKDGAVRHIHTSRKEVLWNGKMQYQLLCTDITTQYQAEEALKLSEQNFRNSIDSSSVGINIVDADFATLYANKAFLDIFGYGSVDEAKIKRTYEQYTQESYTGYLLRKERIARGEPLPDFFEIDIVRKDGSVRHIQVSRKEVLWNGTQQYQYFFNDITERAQAEQALKLSEQNFRNSMDNSSIGIRISDTNDNNLYANQAMLNIFGYYDLDEIQKKPPQDYYSPESHSSWVMRHEKLLRGESMPKQIEIDIIRKDGTIRNLQVSMMDVFWNGKQQHQTLYNDLTEFKQAEAALQASEKNYQSIVENTRDIIFTLNAMGEYVYVSPSVTDLLGYNPTDLIGKAFVSIVYPDDIPIIQEEIVRSNLSGYQTTDDREYRIRNASGEWRWVVSKGTRVVDSSGKFVHFIGIIKDITEHKQADAERQQLEEKAQVASRLAAVGEMAAGIAHEINNPLTGVIGFSQMILEKENVPEEIKDELKLIADGSQRVADIVKRLLTFARQTKPVKAMTNLNDLIDNTLKLRNYVLKTANIEVVTRFDPELPWSVVDPGQMQQVFLNLIVNAEQAMKEAHGRGTLTITTEKKENNIRMSFQDDGPGITREIMKRLFEPFFTTKAPGEGTGLGLSLSRSIILEHNGKLYVESEPGHGADFIVELPIIDSTEPETEELPAAAMEKPASTQHGNILVVDDESGVRIFLKKALTQMGHTVDTIADAQTAMEKLDSGTTYDIILTDVRMAGISGIELYFHIIEKTPAMKNRIVFITGDIMGPDIKNFFTQNGLTYLTKPFSIETMREKINRILMTGQPNNNNLDGSGR